MIIESPTEDMKVRKTIVMLLGTWATKFKGEQGMQILYRLHERGRLTIQNNGQPSQVINIYLIYNTLTYLFKTATDNSY